MRKYLPSITAVVSTLVILVIVFAAAEAAGFTGAIISPISFFKNKFKGSA